MRSGDHDRDAPRETPVQAAARGAAAGLSAALLLSALSRVLPGLRNPAGEKRPGRKPAPPRDPFNPREVREWQERSQSPAAFQSTRQRRQQRRRGEPPGITPAGALAQPQGPGPEGLAEQFAFKLAAGMFHRDISPHVRPAGVAVHLVYGSLWGSLYGLLQASYRLRPGLFGPLYGTVVYGIGPAFLVPAMKIMGWPSEEPPVRTAMLIAGHIAYGAAVAEVFDILGEELES